MTENKEKIDKVWIKVFLHTLHTVCSTEHAIIVGEDIVNNITIGIQKKLMYYIVGFWCEGKCLEAFLVR